ncbi:hypothetical protein [Thalassovita sp.]|jgi:hypothetical protein|uniref:hypothetical protein n=1 Tax=Thalassovita sp. TaxID=1979401 RepID=UPI003B5B7E77
MAETRPPQRLEKISRAVRTFLEPYWAAWHRRGGSPNKLTLSQGMCGRSSLFLRDVLRSEGEQADFVIGSPSEGPQGYRFEGVWRGHAWVQSGDWIVDVTADQFGKPDVVITPVGDEKYKAGQDTAMPEIKAQRQQMAQELMSKWVEQMGDMHET